MLLYYPIDEDREFNKTLDIVFDSIFGFDILKNFISAYIDSEDNVIKSYPKISINYLKSWFFIDFFTILPIERFIQSNQSSSYCSSPKIISFSKVNKAFQNGQSCEKGICK